MYFSTGGLSVFSREYTFFEMCLSKKYAGTSLARTRLYFRSWESFFSRSRKFVIIHMIMVKVFFLWCFGSFSCFFTLMSMILLKDTNTRRALLAERFLEKISESRSIQYSLL